ncbi:restriction endonuclease subunit S, partial [Candidatus Pelagibacter sp.]|nr:restriction endonuclease subunit S [Candidatus Pelagibacter sp.]
KLSKFEEKIITGKTPSTKIKDNFNGLIPFICIDDIRGNVNIFESKVKLSDKGAKTQIKKFLPEKSICVSCIASPGLVGLTTEKSQTNQQINSIICEKEENIYYLYFYLKEYFKNTKAKLGNTFANMNKDDFSNILILKPNKEILIKFHDLVKNYMDKIYFCEKENLELKNLREYLLPKLMTGQINIF